MDGSEATKNSFASDAYTSVGATVVKAPVLTCVSEEYEEEWIIQQSKV